MNFLFRIVLIAFAEEATPEGRKWPPLSPAYAARKQGPQMLVETGRLYQSLIDDDDSDHIFRGRNRKLQLGTKVPYAGYATERRPVLPKDYTHYAEIFGYALTATITRRGKVLPVKPGRRFNPRRNRNRLVRGT